MFVPRLVNYLSVFALGNPRVALGMFPPLLPVGTISFIFMQFSAKNLSIKFQSDASPISIQIILFSSGSRSRVVGGGGGTRNMKSMQPPSMPTFLWLIFTEPGGAWPLARLDPATVSF